MQEGDVHGDSTGQQPGLEERRYLNSVYQDIPDPGFALMLIPAGSEIHQVFALEGPSYPGFAGKPLMGWISGVNLKDLDRLAPKVFHGGHAESLENHALVMHVALPGSKMCDLDIINIFEPGGGDVLTFEADGFEVREVRVNGEKRNFAEYIVQGGLDTRLPIVADYSGAKINTSFQSVDADQGAVKFYAPVFAGIEYRHAQPVEDYVSQFLSQMEDRAPQDVAFACNCILNYLYSDLEGKHTGGFQGPFTFGEIAYQLLNQTMVYLSILDK